MTLEKIEYFTECKCKAVTIVSGKESVVGKGQVIFLQTGISLVDVRRTVVRKCRTESCNACKSKKKKKS